MQKTKENVSPPVSSIKRSYCCSVPRSKRLTRLCRCPNSSSYRRRCRHRDRTSSSSGVCAEWVWLAVVRRGRRLSPVAKGCRLRSGDSDLPPLTHASTTRRGWLAAGWEVATGSPSCSRISRHAGNPQARVACLWGSATWGSTRSRNSGKLAWYTQDN